LLTELLALLTKIKHILQVLVISFVALLEIADISDGVITRYETEVRIRLRAQRLQYDLHLISFPDLVVLPGFNIIGGFARRQWEAGSALEKVPHLLEILVFEMLVRLQGVQNQLVYDATQTPHIRRLIILLFHEGNLRCSIPSRPHMDRKIPFHLPPPGPVALQHSANHFLLIFIVFPIARFHQRPLLFLLLFFGILPYSLSVEVFLGHQLLCKTP